MQNFCPKCNTPAYDDTSFFCHKCGMQLPVYIKENKRYSPQTPNVKVPVEESMNARDESLSPPKPASIQQVKPDSLNESLLTTKPVSSQRVKPGSASFLDDVHVPPKQSSFHSANLIETCAQCGGPIIDTSRIFCTACGVNIREDLYGEKSSIVKHPVFEPLVMSPVAYQTPQIETIKEQGSIQNKETHISPNSKYKWRLIAIIAGIVTLFLIYMLILLLIYLGEVNHTFPMPI